MAQLPDGSVKLTWNADADFESGVQAFIVQRDGKDVARVPENSSGRFGRPLFQDMSYHDTPEAPLPAMAYVDKPGDDARHEYRIVVVNGIGLKSEPSKPAAEK